jgi:flavodoxin I
MITARGVLMKTLIVYDSVYGNTEQIAKAIAGAIAPLTEVTMCQAAQATPATLEGVDLLIAGAPTHGGRPSPAMQTFLNQIPAGALNKVRVTAFDTRISAEGKGIGLRILMKLLGYAAERMAGTLQRKGGRLAQPPAGFIVDGKEGPLKAGELERAAQWAQGIQRTTGTLQYATG